ncbi:MAG: hypothetical protein HRT52_20910 [Colwellia sp.]|nr:hypothetical protein [Colwellia sp.]
MSIQLHQNIQISSFVSPGHLENNQFLIQCEHLNYVVSTPVKTLIESLILYQNSNETLVESYFTTTQRNASEQDIITLARQHIPKELFANTEITDQRNPFIFSMTLLPERFLSLFSVLLTPLFNKWLCLITIVTLISVHGSLLAQISQSATLGIPIGSIPTFILAMLFSYFIHELGHISACQRYNCPHGSIGFGIYLVFPVFYADVSKAWRLSQKQRAVVDLGGLYFQSMLIIAIDCFAYFTESQLAYVVSWTITFTMLHTLNPFFKFDGYWLLSDLSGITNLHDKMRTSLLRVKHKILHGTPLNFREDTTLYLLMPYSALAMLFFIYVATFLSRKLWQTGQDIASALSKIQGDSLSESFTLMFEKETLLPLLKTTMWAVLFVLLLSFYLKRIKNLLVQDNNLEAENK